MADEMEGETYSHLVVGGGPGGISAVVSLLDHGIRDILWVDPDFNGGRLNSLYREISSNTKTGIYLDALSSSKTCREMIEHAQKPNPITKLEEKDKDQTCELSFAGDMIMFLFDHLVRLGIKIKRDEVREMEYEDNRWIVRLGEDEVTVDKIILATGSHPVIGTIHEKYNDKLRVLDLDDVLQKSKIPALFQNPLPPNNPPNQNDPSNQNSHCDPMSLDDTVIGIIGNSHSGILALRNLFETLPRSTLILFERHDVVYAEYTDDGIIHDNTGLKGLTAEWAKEVLEVGNNRIQRVRLPVDQDDLDSIYARWLVKCHVLVYAIGYERNAIPLVRFNKERIDKELEFDMHSSGFYTTHDGSIDADETDKHESEDDDTEHDKKFLPGLYGCGIAFPEEVKDPGGNVEAAVGIAKFFRFAERVSETWAKTS